MPVFRRKHSRYWWLSYMFVGKQRQESTRSTSKRVAEKMLAIRLAEIAEGRFRLVASNPPQLEKWADEFLEAVPKRSTKDRYSSSVKALKKFMGKARLSEITPKLIEEFKAARLKGGVGPAAVNRDLAILRQLLKRAARHRLIGQSPMTEEVDFLDEKKVRRQPHILTFEEQEKLLAVTSPRLRALIVLVTETGLRVRSEALPLRWDDIDFENNSVHVRESKTVAGRRVVPLSDLCKAELQRWKDLTGPAFSDYVFPSLSKPKRHLRTVRTPWTTVLKNVRLPYFPMYNLRHTFASRLNAAGASTLTIAGLLGHSGPGIVQTYAKVLDDTRRKAIRRLEELRQSHSSGPAKQQATGTVN